MKKRLRKALSILLVMMLIVGLVPANCFTIRAEAVVQDGASGTGDGTYDFNGLTANPAPVGGGFVCVGNKFAVEASKSFQSYPCVDGTSNSGIYPFDGAAQANDGPSYSVTIKAEGGSACKSFTFKDMGLSGNPSAGPYSFFSCSISFYDSEGGLISQSSRNTLSGIISNNSVTQLSSIMGLSPWDVKNVSSLQFVFSLRNDAYSTSTSNGAANLQFENITIADVSNTLKQSTPTFTPAAGAVTLGTSLQISSPGADHIYYTTDGSIPATSVTGTTLEYNDSARPTISSAMTVNAIATKAGYTASDVGTSTYTQSPSANLTGISPSTTLTGYTFNGGTYNYSGLTVANAISGFTITPTGAGVITVNGETVGTGTASSSVSLTPGVEKQITIVATETGKSPKTYNLYVTRALPTQTTPTFNPVSGAVAFGTELQIISSGAEHIYYTTDSSAPAASVTGATLEYNDSSRPVISSGMTVKAIATQTGYVNSAVGTTTYTQAATGNLSGLTLSGSPSGYIFAGGTYTYNSVTVANGVSSVTVTPTGTGTITVNGATVASGAASSGIALTPGAEETITIVATETGKTAKTYVIKVTRGLPTQVDPVISPSGGAVALGTEMQMTATGAEHIYYTTDGSTPATSITGVTLEYNDSARPVISSAMTVKAIAIRTGYINSGVVTEVYTQGATGNLSGLSVSGSPSGYTFVAGTYTYNSVTVANGVSSVTVTPTGTGTITVNGATVASGAASSGIALTPGAEETITIVATETGKTAKTYVIKVTRGLPTQVDPVISPSGGAIALGTEMQMTATGAEHIYYTTDGSTPATSITGVTHEYNDSARPIISGAMTVKAIANRTGYINSGITTAVYTQASTANLSGLSIGGSPSGYTFVAGTYAYNSVTVVNAVDSVTVTPIGTGTITVNGVTVASGAASGAIALTAGVEETITIVATETGKIAKTYVIKVTRGLPTQATPIFSPTTGAVAFGTELQITSAGAEHIYYTTDGSTPATSVTGTTSEYNDSARPVISSAMTVKAIAVRTGYINSGITSADYTQATTANLSGLFVSGSPSGYTFAAGTYAYNGVTVASIVDSVTVTPAGTGTITVNGITVASGATSGAIALTAGVEETITIVATETGKTAKTYIIKVTRGLPTQVDPVISPSSGAVAFGTSVQITATGAEHIYYTTNGTTPATSVTGTTLEYNDSARPVINSAMTVKAIATRTGYIDSGVATEIYTQAATANLSGLVLSGSPSNYTFAGGTYAYNSVTVTNGVSSVTVTPTGTGTITVNGTAVTSGAVSDPISLTAGVEKTITVAVTETGKTNRTYTIKINRAVATSSGGGGGSGNGGSGGSGTVNSGTAPSTTTGVASGGKGTTQTAGATTGTNDIKVVVGGETQEVAGTTKTVVVGNQEQHIVVLDQTKVDSILAKIEAKNVDTTITVPVTESKADIVISELNGQTVKDMDMKSVVLEIKTDKATYSLPAEEINIDAVSKNLGENITLRDIKVNVEIKKPTEAVIKEVQDNLGNRGIAVVVSPVEFNVTCTYGEKTVNVNKFESYVQRLIAIPADVDSTKITTAIVVDSDQKTRQVPTEIVKIDGKYYAKINSLTNSVYSVVWNPRTFKDTKNVWAGKDMDEIASRMIMEGETVDKFNPNGTMTKGDFIGVLVRALGLKESGSKQIFTDVKPTDKNAGYIMTAYEYGLLAKNSKAQLNPSKLITRKEMMEILLNATKLTKLKINVTEKDTKSILSEYKDTAKTSQYTRNMVVKLNVAKIMSVKTYGTIRENQIVRRSEVAHYVLYLLKMSKLIN